MATWHYGGSNPSYNKNDWTGTFSTPAKQAEFEAITTTVNAGQFQNENGLTGVSILNATDIGDNAFHNTPLRLLSIPKALRVGDGAFNLLSSQPAAHATIPNALHSQVVRIFGANAHSNIIFDYRYNGGWWWGGVDGPSDTKNDYKGIYHSNFWNDFEGIKTAITTGKFRNTYDYIYEISFPNVVIIENSVFRENKYLNRLYLPKCTEIGTYCFLHADITSLSLPEVTDIGDFSFNGSHLTHLSLPKAANIGDHTFRNIVNAPTTTVTLPSKFNSNTEKDRIFGAGNWDQITFDWDGAGTPATPSTKPPITATNWHYGNGHGGPSSTGNDWEGTFPIGDPQWQKEFQDFGESISGVDQVDHDYIGIPKFSSLTAISLPKTVRIGRNIFSASSVHELNLPKATTIGENAFRGIVNKASTIVHMKARFNTIDAKNLIFGIGNWNDVTFNWLPDTNPHPTSPSSIPQDHEVTVTWHYGDGAGGPHATKNDWAGSFSSHNKQLEFEAITDHVDDHEFNAQEHLMAISLPQVTKIGLYSFFISKMGAVNLPKVLSIGNNALYNTANNVRTTVTLPDVFNTDAEKNRIFGDHQWGHMTFIWKHDAIPANTIFWNGKIQDTQFEMDGKTVTKFVWIIKDPNAIAPTDSFTVTKQPGPLDSKNLGIAIDETKKFTRFATDVVLDPELTTPGSAFGNHAVYTKKELNDWLANPSSVSGEPVATDWRITRGDYQSDIRSNLAIEFKEVDGKRIITRAFVKPENANYQLFANQHMFFTFTVDNGVGGDSVKECVLKELVPPGVDFNPDSGRWTKIYPSGLSFFASDWWDLAFHKNKAIMLNTRTGFMRTADVSSTGYFSNFKEVNFSPSINSDSLRNIKIYGNKVYLTGFYSSGWIEGEIDDDGNFTNMKSVNLQSKLTTSRNYWTGFEIYGKKAYFCNEERNKFMTADIPDGWDKSLNSLTNFQTLDISSKLTTSSSQWNGFRINGNKMYFVNNSKARWMTADIDSQGNLTNFQRLDLSSKLTSTYDIWHKIAFHDDKVYFINQIPSDWNMWSK